MDLTGIHKIQDIVISNAEALIVGAGIILLVFVFWLAIRGLRLWYWKTDQKLDAIKEIDRGLRELKEEIRANNAMQNQKNINIVNNIEAGRCNQEIQTEESEPDISPEGESQPDISLIGETGSQPNKVQLDEIEASEEKTVNEAVTDVETPENQHDIEIEKERHNYNYKDRNCGIAKDGNVYTREEIMATIKD